MGRWDISSGIVQKHHISHSTTNEDPTRSHRLVIKRPSSVILAQMSRKSRETDAAGGCKVSREG